MNELFVHSLKIFNEVIFEEDVVIANRVDDHQQAIVNQFATLRSDTSLSDVVLRTTVDGREFPAHKLVLSTRSPVFQAMFSHGSMVENVNNLVEVAEMRGEVMQSLLDYIYSGTIGDIKNLAPELLEAADKVRSG